MLIWTIFERAISLFYIIEGIVWAIFYTFLIITVTKIVT